MTAPCNQTTETPYELGRRAYNEGAPISEWPSEVETGSDYEEWRRGWEDAWKEDGGV